jgi:hypothetical protein
MTDGRSRRTAGARWPIPALLVIAALATLGSACTQPPDTYAPEIAGVVVSRDDLPDGSSRLTLENGRSHVVDTDTQKLLFGGANPVVGELLLAGSRPAPWFARVARRFECFWIGGSGVEEGGYITTEGGFRLPESADFVRGPYAADEHEFHGGGFCVNGSGEITAVVN